MRLTYPKLVHMTLAGVLTWLGIILATPSPTFALSPSYRLMARIGPEWAWAIVFMAAGVWGFWTAFRGSDNSRWWSMVLLAALHGAFGLLLAGGSLQTTGSGTYCLMGVMGFLHLYLTARDAGA